MREEVKITARQYTFLIANYTLGSSILFAPAGLAGEAKQDLWLAGLITLAINALLMWLYIGLMLRFPGKGLVQVNELLLGKWVGMALNMLYVYSFFLQCGMILREVGDFLAIHMLRQTPIEIVHLLFVGLVVMAARLGLVIVSRCSELLFPIVALLFAALVLLLLPKADYANLMPVLEDGLKPVLQGASIFLGMPFLTSYINLMFLPEVDSAVGSKKGLLIGSTIGGGALLLISVLSVMVIGTEYTANSTYASYQLAQKINIGNFIERNEAVIAVIWFITIFFMLTLTFMALLKGAAQMLRCGTDRELAYPMGMIVFALSVFIVPDITEYGEFIDRIWPGYVYTLGMLIPVLLLIAAALRSKKVIREGAA